MYLVLGILYESLVHPVTILSTLPSAGVGALLALLGTGTEFSIIAVIGVILLIGIVKKNAIMMIDFALQLEREQQLEPRDAIHRASLLRLRPILMTTVAALFGALPLAIGTGDGAEMRRPLGIAIVGGLILSQLLTLYTTPVIYVYFDRFSSWSRRKLGGRLGRPELGVGAALVLLCLLAGCAVGPDYKRPQAGTPPMFIARTNTLPDVPETPTLIPATLLERRPDIAAAERRTAAANAQIGVARAAYFPDLSLTGTGGYESNEFSSLFSVPNRFWSLGPNLAQTIFDAGAIHAQVKQNIAAYDFNVATYRETVLTAFQDVEDNLATLKLLAEESQAEVNAAKAAELTLEITQNQYQAGTVDYLNVVVAQQTALTAERAVRDLANRRLTASVGLLKALGGGWRTSDLVH